MPLCYRVISAAICECTYDAVASVTLVSLSALIPYGAMHAPPSLPPVEAHPALDSPCCGGSFSMQRNSTLLARCMQLHINMGCNKDVIRAVGLFKSRFVPPSMSDCFRRQPHTAAAPLLDTASTTPGCRCNIGQWQASRQRGLKTRKHSVCALQLSSSAVNALWGGRWAACHADDSPPLDTGQT